MGVTPILEPMIFVWLSLFLISTHSKNLIYLALMVYKLKILATLFEGEPSILMPPKFVKFDLFIIFAYSKKFHVSGISG